MTDMEKIMAEIAECENNLSENKLRLQELKVLLKNGGRKRRQFKEGSMTGKTGEPKYLIHWHEYYKTVKDLDIMYYYPKNKKKVASLLRQGMNKGRTLDELLEMINADDNLLRFDNLKIMIENLSPLQNNQIKKDEQLPSLQENVSQ